MGAAVGCTAQMIGLLEKGHRLPSMRLAARLHERFGIDPGDWTRPAICGPCGRSLGNPVLFTCTRGDCPHLARQPMKAAA